MGVKITDFATLEDAVKEIEQQEVEIRSLEEKIKRLESENKELDGDNDYLRREVAGLESDLKYLKQEVSSLEEDMVKEDYQINTSRSVITIGIDNGNLLDSQLCEAFCDLLESNISPLFILERCQNYLKRIKK